MPNVQAAKRNIAWRIRRATAQMKEARKNLYYRVRETPTGHVCTRARPRGPWPRPALARA